MFSSSASKVWSSSPSFYTNLSFLLGDYTSSSSCPSLDSEFFCKRWLVEVVGLVVLVPFKHFNVCGPNSVYQPFFGFILDGCLSMSLLGCYMPILVLYMVLNMHAWFLDVPHSCTWVLLSAASFHHPQEKLNKWWKVFKLGRNHINLALLFSLDLKLRLGNAYYWWDNS